MRHAYGHSDADCHIYSHANGDGNCHVHANGDIHCNSDGDCHSNGYGNSDRPAAAFTVATATADTAGASGRQLLC